MAQQTKQYLKNRFKTGSKPTQQDFADLIDSLVHFDDIEAVNAVTIDARITEYDTAQKAVSGQEQVTSLGDVLQVLRNVDAAADIQDEIDSAGGEVSWGDIQEKPVGAVVIWDEYTFTLENYTYYDITSYESIGLTRIVEDQMPANIKTAIAGKKWQLLDIAMTNVPIRMENDSKLLYPVSRLRSVRIGVNPRIQFPV